MRLQHFAPMAGLAATVQAGHAKMMASGLGTGISAVGSVSTDWITSVVPSYTVYCPSPTTWAYLNTTYTITSETTVTLPCPCTISVSSPAPVIVTSTYTTDVPCTETTPAAIPSDGVPFPSVNITGIPVPFPPLGTGVTTVSLSSSVVVTTMTSTPLASTIVSGTTALGGAATPLESGTTSGTTTAPTNIPVAPTTTPGVVTVNGAYRVASGAGALGLAAGVAAFIF